MVSFVVPRHFCSHACADAYAAESQKPESRTENPHTHSHAISAHMHVHMHMRQNPESRIQNPGGPRPLQARSRRIQNPESRIHSCAISAHMHVRTCICGRIPNPESRTRAGPPPLDPLTAQRFQNPESRIRPALSPEPFPRPHIPASIIRGCLLPAAHLRRTADSSIQNPPFPPWPPPPT